jgi:transcriptional regulator with XRE-family HTH domain
MKAIEKNIKNIREIRNLSQQYVSTKLGMTQAGYSKIENGSTILTFIRLRDIAEILNVSVDAIITFDGSKLVSDIHLEETGFKSSLISQLYEDQINLYKLLLTKTELELDWYKARYGVMNVMAAALIDISMVAA